VMSSLVVVVVVALLVVVPCAGVTPCILCDTCPMSVVRIVH